MDIAVNLDKSGELAALWARAPAICREELLGAITEMDALLLREVQEATPTAQGTLRAGMHSEESVTEFGVTGITGSSLIYAQPVELGTRPHFPPVEALTDWVRLKLGISDEREVRSVAFLIARKISRVGTKGAFMFRDAVKRLEPVMEARFVRARDRIVARLAGA